jgi:hypothetical protein
VAGLSGVSGYGNTDEGKLVVAALLDAHNKLVTQVRATRPNLPPVTGEDSSAAPDFVPGGYYTPVVMLNVRGTAGTNAAVVGLAGPGVILVVTGERRGDWWRVRDRLRRMGVVALSLLALSRATGGLRAPLAQRGDLGKRGVVAVAVPPPEVVPDRAGGDQAVDRGANREPAQRADSRDRHPVLTTKPAGSRARSERPEPRRTRAFRHIAAAPREAASP